MTRKRRWPRAIGARLAKATVAVAVLLLVACAEGDPPIPEGAEALSLLAEPLYPAEDDDGRVAEADRALEESPESLERLLDAAAARASLWRYREAIDLYTRAAELHPDDWRPLRFRGHRYISTRRFADGAADLERARELAPHSFDVAYHLGLAYYLDGRFDEAVREYARCVEMSARPDPDRIRESAPLDEEFRSCLDLREDDEMRVALNDWFYRSLRRADRHEEAGQVLRRLPETPDVEANRAYLDLLEFYRGDRSAEELLAPTDDELRSVTVGYGLANWYLVEGDTARALELLEATASDPVWPGFGRIAAEANLARLLAEGR